jgi:serine/threonine protein kinase
VHDVGEAAGHPFLVMELLDGRTLREQIDGKPLDISTVLALSIEVTDALDAAHSKGTSSGNNLAGPDSNTRVQSNDLGLSRFHWWLIRVTFRAWNWCYGISAKRK